MLLIIAIICFGLAALFGIYLLSFVLREKNTPKGIALLHGVMAGSGLLLIIIYSFFYHSPMAALIIFILAALGGLFIFYQDITGKSIPKFLAIGHGTLAIIGFILLILFSYHYFSTPKVGSDAQHLTPIRQ